MASNDWYVYTLAWHTGLVFYVGRGQGHSWERHEQKAIRGEVCRVTDTICEIWLRGEALIKHKELENVTEEEAYQFQVQLYQKYALLNPVMASSGSYPRPLGHGKAIGRSRKIRGYKQSEAAKERMSKSRQGKTYTPERKVRNYERLKNTALTNFNTPESKAKMAKTNTGKKRPDWVIEKINETRKSTWENLTYEERMVRLEPWIKAGQEASRKIVKDTKIERYVEAQLIATEIEYQKQFRIGIYSCDFYIPSQNKIIEVNGCFYHQCPECGFANRRTEEIRAKDARKVAYLESKGFIVEVIWEHSIDPSELKKFS